MKASSAGWVRTDFPALGIALHYPGSWIAVDDERAVAFVERSSGGFRANMMVSLEQIEDLDTYLDQALAEMTSFLTDLEVGDRAAVEVAGTNATRLSSSYRQGTFDLRLEQWLIPRGDGVLVVTATWAPSLSPAFADEVEEVVAGVEWKAAGEIPGAPG